MAKIYRVTFILLLFSWGCANNERRTTEKPENSIAAASYFIRAALDGKFDEARIYLLPDSVNTNYLDLAGRSYQRIDDETKIGYRSASIRIHNVNYLTKDSITIVIYSNSYKNDHDTLKVLKEKGQWLVDLKYLYEHDMDTLFNKPASKDSIK